MARTHQPRTAKRVPPSYPVVRDLFVPVSAFLLRSGMTKAQLLSEWRTAINQASQAKPAIPVVRIGFENLASSIISRWLRDPTYLNHVGRPDDLPLRGKRSITSLLKAGHVKVPPSKVLTLLVEMGTVKRMGPGRYRLVQRSMSYIIPDYLPFEPNFQFLVDAARACTWGSGHLPRTPRLYWLNATSTRVNRRHAPEFLRFSKERGLSFIHEINDWLEAHELQDDKVPKKKQGIAKAGRLGMTLFGVCSDMSK